MKIICVEEHTSDPGLAKAGRPVQQLEAPYFTEVGTDFPGRLDDGDDHRAQERDWLAEINLS